MIAYVKYRFIKRLILYAKGEDTIMSFLDTIDIELSNKCLERSVLNLSNSLFFISLPYYDLNSNLKAIGHPFFHATQLLLNVGYFAYEMVFLMGSLSNCDWSGAGNIAFSMLKVVLASSLEILNIALSIISLVTRTLASIYNWGYVSSTHQISDNPIIGGLNNEQTENLANSLIHFNSRDGDESIHKKTFELI